LWSLGLSRKIELLKNSEKKRKLSIDHILAKKKLVFNVNRFHSMSGVLLKCVFPFILLEKINRDWEMIFLNAIATLEHIFFTQKKQLTA
jgi:hypothetical protein